jgi:hypothetical protein
MALLTKSVLANGLVVDNSYTRIFFLNMNGDKEKLTIGVQYFIRQEAIQEGKTPLKSEYYDFSPSVEDGSENFIKQGYEHLKGLPEFTGAVDVLE